MSKFPEAKKALGQHWLEDEESLADMVRAGEVCASDTVLEIGPGTGTLTEKLTETNANIIALEFDRARYKDLIRIYKDSANVVIKEGDIRAFNLNDLSPDYKIIANIPYYLTANLLRILSESDNMPKIAVLLVQKEVAQRVGANPGELSILAVFTQIHYDVSLGRIVPAQLFSPPPKVDSQILILHRKSESRSSQIPPQLTRVIKAGFSQKRKKLVNNLATGLGLGKEDISKILQDCNLRADIRAQQLTLGQWEKISNEISQLTR